MSKSNSKLLTVQEFDGLTYKNEYKNRGYKIIKKDNEEEGKKIFNELIKFIHEFSSNENNTDALEFMSILYKRGVEDIVKFKNYVGLIELNSGFQIEVLPKILLSNTNNEEENIKNTREIFLKMLMASNDIEGKAFNNANLNCTHMDIYEIFINLYVQEVVNLVKKGLKSAYMDNEENLNIIRGKILLKEQLKYNFAHEEKMYCIYDDYNYNRAENKIIKTTLLKLLKITKNIENLTKIKQALLFFETVIPSNNYEYDFSKVNITRDMENYEFLMKWSKVFLQNKSFSTFSGTTNSKALLFKMDKLFETYVAKMIKKWAYKENKNWKITTQDNKLYLINEPEAIFKLKPDIVIEKDSTKIILDTKWKILDSNKHNYGISQNDMYQMFSYAQKYNIQNIVLLYPITEDMKQFANKIWYKSKIENSYKDVTIKVFFIDLDNSNFAELISEIEKIGE